MFIHSFLHSSSTVCLSFLLFPPLSLSLHLLPSSPSFSHFTFSLTFLVSLSLSLSLFVWSACSPIINKLCFLLTVLHEVTEHDRQAGVLRNTRVCVCYCE